MVALKSDILCPICQEYLSKTNQMALTISTILLGITDKKLSLLFFKCGYCTVK